MKNNFTKLYDKNFRRNLRNAPGEYAQKLGYHLGDAKVQVVTNTGDVVYMAINYDDDTGIDLKKMRGAGNKKSSLGSAGSISSISTESSTVSSFGTLGSVSTSRPEPPPGPGPDPY